MKRYLLYLFCLVWFAACSKDKTGVTGETGEDPGMLNYTGSFYPTQWIMAAGRASVFSGNNGTSLKLDSFAVSEGPDLKVYLSKKNIPFEYINLGPLKSNSGTQYYTVPAATDFTIYRYVLIHCQQYNHLFAIAELKP